MVNEQNDIANVQQAMSTSEGLKKFMLHRKTLYEGFVKEVATWPEEQKVQMLKDRTAELYDRNPDPELEVQRLLTHDANRQQSWGQFLERHYPTLCPWLQQ